MIWNITQDLRFRRMPWNEICHDKNWVLSTGKKGWRWPGKVLCSGMWRRVGRKDPAASTFRLDKWRWRSGSLETSVFLSWKNQQFFEMEVLLPDFTTSHRRIQAPLGQWTFRAHKKTSNLLTGWVTIKFSRYNIPLRMGAKLGLTHYG